MRMRSSMVHRIWRISRIGVKKIYAVKKKRNAFLPRISRIRVHGVHGAPILRIYGVHGAAHIRCTV